MKRPEVTRPRTPGLCCQCSATEPRQPDNHQPSQSSAQVVLKCLSHTPGSHSVYAIKTPLGVDRKFSPSGENPSYVPLWWTALPFEPLLPLTVQYVPLWDGTPPVRLKGRQLIAKLWSGWLQRLQGVVRTLCLRGDICLGRRGRWSDMKSQFKFTQYCTIQELTHQSWPHPLALYPGCVGGVKCFSPPTRPGYEATHPLDLNTSTWTYYKERITVCIMPHTYPAIVEVGSGREGGRHRLLHIWEPL